MISPMMNAKTCYSASLARTAAPRFAGVQQERLATFLSNLQAVPNSGAAVRSSFIEAVYAAWTNESPAASFNVAPYFMTAFSSGLRRANLGMVADVMESLANAAGPTLNTESLLPVITQILKNMAAKDPDLEIRARAQEVGQGIPNF